MRSDEEWGCRGEEEEKGKEDGQRIVNKGLDQQRQRARSRDGRGREIA